MRIWKLTPTNPDDPTWKRWNPEPIFVRAMSEVEARRLAQSMKIKSFPAQPGKEKPINPWTGHEKKEATASLTRCEDVTDRNNEFSVDGPATVLRHGEPL